jgi:hypothetical protein
MTRIRVRTVIPAPRRQVWSDVENLASHVEWMDDAERIDFITPTRSGVGTQFDCRTRVGPFRLVDRMTVTDWTPGHRIGIRHQGTVGGQGRFVLRRRLRGGTVFTWEERLHFPWWLGGPLGATIGRPVLRRIWRRNLANFARRFSA